MRCILIPKHVHIIDIRVEENVLVCLYVNEMGKPQWHESNAEGFECKEVQYWTAIENFDTCAVADLLFVLAGQGREGMSTCRCMKCSATQKEWEAEETNPGRLLTLADLNIDNVGVLGCKGNPLWNLCPTKWIICALHCGMGMTNKVYFHMVNWLLIHLDSSTQEEIDARKEYSDLLDLHEGKVEELEYFCIEVAVKRSQLNKKANTLRRKKKKAVLDNEILAIDAEVTTINEKRTELKTGKINIENDIDSLLDQLRAIKADLKSFVEARKKSKGTLDGRLEDVSVVITTRPLYYFLTHSQLINCFQYNRSYSNSR